MQYLFIGILLGITIEKFIFPFMDTLFEIFIHKMSEIATESKIKSESMAKEFELKYPEKEECSTNVIGYQYEPDDEYYEDDIDNRKKNKIGFRIK